MALLMHRLVLLSFLLVLAIRWGPPPTGSFKDLIHLSSFWRKQWVGRRDG